MIPVEGLVGIVIAIIVIWAVYQGFKVTSKPKTDNKQINNYQTKPINTQVKPNEHKRTKVTTITEEERWS
ncbi:MAG: hypothetical protein K6G81_08410 [Lachnospiraceae bacterium]|nr:hypothetical protein [Lachnospiraceae bacterium]